MTPANYELACERLDEIAAQVVAANPNKAEQARQRSELIGWFVGKVMSQIDGSPERGMIENSVKIALGIKGN